METAAGSGRRTAGTAAGDVGLGATLERRQAADSLWLGQGRQRGPVALVASGAVEVLGDADAGVGVLCRGVWKEELVLLVSAREARSRGR